MLKLYNLVAEGVGGQRGHSPLRILRFTDPAEGHRWAADTLLLEIENVVCNLPPFRSNSSLGRSLYCQRGLSMFACPSMSNFWGVDAVGEEHSQIYCKVAGTAVPACGEKECGHYRVKKVRKCALNREWRSSDVFKVKRREGDCFCEVLWREETGLQYLCVLSAELLFAW